MLMIRLQRVGRTNEPTFRLVLTDSKNGPKSGKYLEVLGHYDPRLENKVEQFKVERIKELMKTGAKLSDTVHNFLVVKKVISGKKINALPKKKPIAKEGVAEAPKAPATPAAAAPAEAPAPAATEPTPAV
ncbi:MAG: 30S ribosomal protein S16 [Patescibacteria group bacterium]